MSDIKVAVNRLAVGIYVKLPLSWHQHPFLRSNFKITSASELTILHNLGLEHVLVDPSKSDVPPLPPVSHRLSDLEQPIAVDTDRLTSEAKIQAQWERLDRQQRYEISLTQAQTLYSQCLSQLNQLYQSPPKLDEIRSSAEPIVNNFWNTLAQTQEHIIHIIPSNDIANNLGAHCLNVTILSMLLAQSAMRSKYEIKLIGQAALFHDLGCLVTDKPKLHHAVRSSQMLTDAGINDHQLLNIINQHHEYLDGSGGPSKLIDEQIHPLAQLLSVANTFDNLCNQDDIKSPHIALVTLTKHYKGKLNNNYIQLLSNEIGVYPPGTLLRLSDGQIALVVAINQHQLLYPFVQLIEQSQQPVFSLADLNVEITEVLSSKELAQAKTILPQAQRISFIPEAFDKVSIK
ncbi:HD-GYP domain-containing protein [Celerinatantimonas sp. MCCC 1A17872]|uniref:HD-GYP domain-containing protein n=1 Tax=Celerinatantimonas sp. MCCC 1A17872 TaxID=3177514 RepID=UPI0038C2CEB0